MEAAWKDCVGIEGAMGFEKPQGASAEVAKLSAKIFEVEA